MIHFGLTIDSMSQYIARDAPMEVNIPSRRRENIRRQIAEFRELLGCSDSESGNGITHGDQALATTKLDAGRIHCWYLDCLALTT